MAQDLFLSKILTLIAFHHFFSRGKSSPMEGDLLYLVAVVLLLDMIFLMCGNNTD